MNLGDEVRVTDHRSCSSQWKTRYIPLHQEIYIFSSIARFMFSFWPPLISCDWNMWLWCHSPTQPNPTSCELIHLDTLVYVDHNGSIIQVKNTSSSAPLELLYPSRNISSITFQLCPWADRVGYAQEKMSHCYHRSTSITLLLPVIWLVHNWSLIKWRELPTAPMCFAIHVERISCKTYSAAVHEQLQ